LCYDCVTFGIGACLLRFTQIGRPAFHSRCIPAADLKALDCGCEPRVGLFASSSWVRLYKRPCHRLRNTTTVGHHAEAHCRRDSGRTELVALRHQVTVLRIWPRVLDAMVLVKPTTVVQWHRQGFRLYWRRRSRHLGRPRMSREIRDLVRTMSRANPLWGAPRIHGELLKLGFDVSQATVGRYLPWRPKVPSPTWRSFLQNHMHDTAAVDMFVVVTATFQLLYALLVLGHERRNVIHFDVTQNPTQVWLARQITEAFPWDTAPRFLLRDRDASYGQTFRNRVQAMAIEEVVTAPRSPWQNAYVERIIGSIRHECLDHISVSAERGPAM